MLYSLLRGLIPSPTALTVHKANPKFATFAPFLEEIKLVRPYELGESLDENCDFISSPNKP